MNNTPILFSGSASTDLAEKIARVPHMGISLGSIYHHQFPSGEWYCQFKENIRGADVFLIQSISHPANDNLMQLLIMADAARRASAGRITAIMPYFGYSRQERKDKPRVPISAKLVMNILEAAGINRVVTMDLHAAQIQGFTDLPVDHLYFRPALVEALKDNQINIDVVVAPDIGAVKRAEEYSRKMKVDLAFISKRRTDDTTVEATQFVGNVFDKNVLIVDDLTESAGTLIAAANVCREQKAKSVYCAVTHNCISDIGYHRLDDARLNSIIDGFFCSNSNVNLVRDTSEKWSHTVNVAPLFSQAIRGISRNESISTLFD